MSVDAGLYTVCEGASEGSLSKVLLATSGALRGGGGGRWRTN